MQLDDPRHEYDPYAAPATDDARPHGEDEPDEHILAERVSDDRRCLHDRIAGTEVVLAPPKAGP
ncbi:hypothetical protein [Sorangium sp. So ce381]|uniref:hypothetical protein n=1 Tax=Sorangium sp. So ce381 TaxID=3133307 RepID=UPI003F5B7A74